MATIRELREKYGGPDDESTVRLAIRAEIPYGGRMLDALDTLRLVRSRFREAGLDTADVDQAMLGAAAVIRTLAQIVLQ